MRIEPRSWSGRVALASTALAAILFSVSVVREHGLVFAIAGICIGVLAAGFAVRAKATKVPDASYSGSADLLSDTGRQLPGQLSFTPSGLTWVPNHYSRARGAGEWSASVAEGLSVSVQRGPALLDLVITAEMPDGDKTRFLAHQSRTLRKAVEGFSA